MALTPDLSKGAAAVNSIFAVLDRVSKIDWTKDGEGERPSAVLGDIEFNNVSFSYPSRLEVPVLKNFSLRVQRGQSLALVGQSGSGKSTIVQLLERFYDPDAGVITLDGRDVRALNVAWVRAQMGLVSQEPVLMDASIADNVRMGLPGATTEQIVEACKAANAHDFISRLPDAYETNCGPKGGRMSGGQKQRIAIARAIIKQPPILLLDEATSALDEESQQIVQQALEAVSEGRTTIIVAHRYSTIKNVDVVGVLERGVLVETGTFDELAAAGGAFTALLRTQGER